jgi:hypothetical protein
MAITEKQVMNLKRGDVLVSPGGAYRIVLFGPKDDDQEGPINRHACYFAKMTRGKFFNASHGHGVTTLYFGGELMRYWSKPNKKLKPAAYRKLVKLERQRLKKLGCKSLSKLFRELVTYHETKPCARPSRSYWPTIGG